MGIEFSLELIKRGYYPKGNGEVKLQVYPSDLKSISFIKRKTSDVKLVCTFSKISNEKIKSEIKLIKKKLSDKNFNVEIEMKNEEAATINGNKCRVD